MPEYLFIGGSQDGKRMPCDLEHVAFPVQIGGPMALVSAEKVCDRYYEREEYNRVKFTEGGEVFRIYVLEGMPPGAVMRSLIENYQAKEKVDAT